MSTTHTQGPLHFTERGDDYARNLRDVEDNVVAILNLGGPREGADARRLAACWNACIDVGTETLEQHPTPFRSLLKERGDLSDRLEAGKIVWRQDQQRIAELMAERDTLLHLLHRVTQEPGWTRMDPPLKADIAKALGMPETPMFPDEATAFAKARADIARGARQSTGKLPG